MVPQIFQNMLALIRNFQTDLKEKLSPYTIKQRFKKENALHKSVQFKIAKCDMYCIYFKKLTKEKQNFLSYQSTLSKFNLL